jgi:hypothetical protein
VDAKLGLFENQLEANLQSMVAMIEDVLVELGHFLEECRVSDPATRRAWRIFRGSAAAHIALLDRADFLHLRILSPVMTLDDSVDRAALFRHLLTLNGSAVRGVAFALAGDEVQLVAERSTLDLDRSEVLDMVERVLRHADEHDDALVATYGGRLGGS